MLNNVRELRKAAGLSLNELAQRSGISRTTIWAIETGRAEVVQSTTLIAIADALGKEVQECFFTQKV